mgnify:CR=1 FL=1
MAQAGAEVAVEWRGAVLGGIGDIRVAVSIEISDRNGAQSATDRVRVDHVSWRGISIGGDRDEGDKTVAGHYDVRGAVFVAIGKLQLDRLR